jgi:hypothetical protein
MPKELHWPWIYLAIYIVIIGVSQYGVELSLAEAVRRAYLAGEAGGPRSMAATASAARTA